ncbi:MAG TPA: thiamine phosphate synthase [Polyangiaceae bacterium]|nr:thiamine phosphate synthase [Polyangiaceae bacterium]
MNRALREACRAGVPPRLVVVTDLDVAPWDLLVSRVGAVLRSATPGSVAVQLRDLERGARERLELGGALASACRTEGQFLVVNDRLDVAVLLGADGVHLGEASVSSAEARRIPGLDEIWVSRACHAADAVSGEDADAVLLSPAAAPRKGRSPLGPEAFRRARASLEAVSARSRPLLYALGGIDAANTAAFRAAGADGVAVIGAVLDGRDAMPLLEALGIRRGKGAAPSGG